MAKLRPVGDGEAGCWVCSPQVLTQVSTSQASLIWQELEAEEEPEARRRHARTPCRPRGQKASQAARQHPDEGCLRYVVLGTMAAIVALFLNVFYPLISQSRSR